MAAVNRFMAGFLIWMVLSALKTDREIFNEMGMRTVNMPAHSLHAYFLRAGQPGVPVLYRVERTRDGRSFRTRSVIAEQEGEIVGYVFLVIGDLATGLPEAMCRANMKKNAFVLAQSNGAS